MRTKDHLEGKFWQYLWIYFTFALRKCPQFIHSLVLPSLLGSTCNQIELLEVVFKKMNRSIVSRWLCNNKHSV